MLLNALAMVQIFGMDKNVVSLNRIELNSAAEVLPPEKYKRLKPNDCEEEACTQAAMKAELECIIEGDFIQFGLVRPKCIQTDPQNQNKQRVTLIIDQRKRNMNNIPEGISEQMNAADLEFSKSSYTPHQAFKFMRDPDNYKGQWSSSLTMMLEAEIWRAMYTASVTCDLWNRLWYARLRHAILVHSDFKDEDREDRLESSAKAIRYNLATDAKSRAQHGLLRNYIETVELIYKKLSNVTTGKIKCNNLETAVRIESTLIMAKEGGRSTRLDPIVGLELLINEEMSKVNCPHTDRDRKWILYQEVGRKQFDLMELENKSMTNMNIHSLPIIAEKSTLIAPSATTSTSSIGAGKKLEEQHPRQHRKGAVSIQTRLKSYQDPQGKVRWQNVSAQDNQVMLVEWWELRDQEDEDYKVMAYEQIEADDEKITLEEIRHEEIRLLHSKQGDNLVVALPILDQSEIIICDVCGIKQLHNTKDCPLGDHRALATSPCFSPTRLAYYPLPAAQCAIELSKLQGYLSKYPNLQYQLLVDMAKQRNDIEQRRAQMRDNGRTNGGYNTQKYQDNRGATSYVSPALKYGPPPGTYEDISRNAVTSA